MTDERAHILAVAAEIEDPIDALCKRFIKQAGNASIKPPYMAVQVWKAYPTTDHRIDRYVLRGIQAHIRSLLKKEIDGLPGWIYVDDVYKKTTGATWRELEANALAKLEHAAQDRKKALRILHLVELVRPFGEAAILGEVVDIKSIDWSKVDEEQSGSDPALN